MGDRVMRYRFTITSHHSWDCRTEKVRRKGCTTSACLVTCLAHHSLIDKRPHFIHDPVDPLHLLLLSVAQPRGQMAHQVRQALETDAAPELHAAWNGYWVRRMTDSGPKMGFRSGSKTLAWVRGWGHGRQTAEHWDMMCRHMISGTGGSGSAKQAAETRCMLYIPHPHHLAGFRLAPQVDVVHKAEGEAHTSAHRREACEGPASEQDDEDEVQGQQDEAQEHDSLLKADPNSSLLLQGCGYGLCTLDGFRSGLPPVMHHCTQNSRDLRLGADGLRASVGGDLRDTPPCRSWAIGRRNLRSRHSGPGSLGCSLESLGRAPFVQYEATKSGQTVNMPTHEQKRNFLDTSLSGRHEHGATETGWAFNHLPTSGGWYNCTGSTR